MGPIKSGVGTTPEPSDSPSMISIQSVPPSTLVKFSLNIRIPPSYSTSSALKTTLVPSSNASPMKTSLARFCARKGSAHDLFDGFSVLTSEIPWDPDNLWSTFSAYFFILHIPLSFGGLSTIAQILHQSVLDPLTVVVSALGLQTTETIGAMVLLYYTAKPHFTFPSFMRGMFNSEQRNWIQASVLGIGFLFGLVFLTSIFADKLVGPKEVNNPILKDILLYNSASRTTCFFLYCLVGPLLEEFVYRGYLLKSLASRTKWWQAVIISSCIFSIAHFSIVNSVQLFIVGCVLGSAYCWSGNLAAPFTIHSVYNATILLGIIISQV